MKASETSVKFIFIGNNFKNLKVELSISNIRHSFSQGNTFKIQQEFFNNEKYIEIFNIFEKETFLFTFQLSIYKGIINHIHYDTRKNVATPAIEMIFFGKKNLPSDINYRGIRLNCFDNNKNRYRKRICLVNSEPNDIEYLNDERFKQKGYKFLDDSYQVILRFSNNDKIQYSVSSIYNEKFFNFISDEPIKISIENEDILELERFCSDYKIFLDCFFELKTLNSKDDVYKDLLDYLISLNDKYDEMKKKDLFEFLVNPLDYKDIQDSLKLIHYSHILFEFDSINKEGKNVKDFYMLRKFIVENNLIEQKLFEQLHQDKSMKEEEKIKFLKSASNILIKLTKASDEVKGIDFVCVEKTNETNSYYKTVEFVTKIIENLDENSRLFEAFLYFDSGIIKNLLEKNNPVNYTIKNVFREKVYSKFEEYKTEFGLTLLNVEQVKAHLKNLIPKLIIRLESQINFRAYYDKDMKIMIINEFKTLGATIETMNSFFYEEDGDKYIIPITIEILHEMLSHGKVRIIEKSEMSPRFFRDSKDNFEYKSIYKMCEIGNGEMENIPIPESGRVLEYFISENASIINILKTPLKENNIFINYKYWISEDFSYIVNTIKNIKYESNSSVNNILFDELDLDNIDDCYIDRGEKYII